MHVISADEIDRILTFPTLVAALASAFAAKVDLPTRHHHVIGGKDGVATHLLMPAWTVGAPGPGSFLGTKIVNVFPDNRRHDLPAVLGLYVLQSGETGAPLAVLDGTRLTHWRTAAASALATSFLARADARRLLVVGAGALAPFLVRAHASARPIEEVAVWNHRPAGAEALAASLRAEGFAARAVTSIEDAVRQADIVSCATLAQRPIIAGAWLSPGTHLDLVGAFSMTMREADDEALCRARLFVDTSAALHEGGDVALGILGGAIAADDIVATLHDLCGGRVGRTAPAEITIFKSVGTAIEDLAAAILVWQGSAAA